MTILKDGISSSRSSLEDSAPLAVAVEYTTSSSRLLETSLLLYLYTGSCT